MEKWRGEEKRRFTRGDFPCKIYLYTPDQRIISLYTKDISRGGVGLMLDEKLDEGAVVNVESFLLDEHVTRKGKIVRVQEQDGQYFIGIEFIGEPK